MRRPASAVSHAVASGFLLKDLQLRSRSFLARESIRPKSTGKSSPPPRCPAARGLLSSGAREFHALVPHREVADQPLPSAFPLPAQMPRARSAGAAESCQSHQFSFASPRSSSLSSPPPGIPPPINSANANTGNQTPNLRNPKNAPKNKKAASSR